MIISKEICHVGRCLRGCTAVCKRAVCVQPGDTTEAMRAAFEVVCRTEGLDPTRYELDRDGTRPYYSQGTCMAYRIWQAALAHPTPAAPAVTDSTHTGAVLEAAHLAWRGALKACGVGDADRAAISDVVRSMLKKSPPLALAAQPSPDRNDCEPVAGIGLGHAVGCTSHQSAHAKCNCGYEGRALRGTTLDVDYRMRQQATPPPPAERNEWHETIDDALIIRGMDCTHAGETPKQALERIIGWEVMVATDPAVNGGFVLVSQAERHYCERCGKRLGHTEGVHTCTPPGGAS